jgi:hypothetical protein
MCNTVGESHVSEYTSHVSNVYMGHVLCIHTGPYIEGLCHGQEGRRGRLL